MCYTDGELEWEGTMSTGEDLWALLAELAPEPLTELPDFAELLPSPDHRV